MNKIPGIILVILLAIVAYIASNLPFAPFTLANGTHPIEAMAAGLLIGIIVSSCWKIPDTMNHGIKFSMKTLLSVGIVLLGFKLSLHTIAAMPLGVLMVIILASLGALLSAIILGKLTKHDPITSLYLGVGNAICGSSAIMAISNVLPPKDKNQTGMAVTTVNLLGLVLVFALPAIAHFLKLDDMQMGLWAGATGQAVPQAIAAGFTFSQKAGVFATAIKLTRVLQLGLYVFILKLIFHKSSHDTHNKKSIFNFIPLFIILFIVVVLINSAFTINPNILHWLGSLSAFLLTMALTAIGLNTHLKTLIKEGGKNILIGGLSSLVSILIALGGCYLIY